MPIHLRWELYPIAHETKRPYGGSYLEDMNWWTKPLNRSWIGVLKFMSTELLFFRLFYRLNRKYWYWVYSFHLGTFSLIAWLMLLLIGALLSLGDTSIVTNLKVLWGGLFYYAILVFGLAGFIITGIGITGLLFKRLTLSNLKMYTSPLDYFNMVFILAIVISGLAAWYLYDREFVIAKDFIKSLITLSPMISINPVTYINIFLICIFLIYSPFTRMTHYIAKYFTYHKVLWDDTPNIALNKKEKLIQPLLEQVPDWSNASILPDRTWKQLAKDELCDKKSGESG
jgi:nitrate reductase gamma subunit